MSYRYSDFLKLYQNLKKLATNVQEDDFFYGLRCMLEDGFVNRFLAEQHANFTMSHDASFTQPNLRQSMKVSSEKHKALQRSYGTIYFPSKKLFKMSASVIH